MTPENDPECWTLLCQAERGMTTWYDVYMFVFCGFLLGVAVGWQLWRRFGPDYEALRRRQER